MMKNQFQDVRRQDFLDEESYANTLKQIADDRKNFESALANTDTTAHGRVTARMMIASYDWFVFRLQYTAGVPVEELAHSLDGIVASFEAHAEELKSSLNPYDRAAFNLADSIDEYVDYLNLLSVLVLLRRTDLLPRAAALLTDTILDGQDAIVEDLLKFFISGRPAPDESYWGKPFQILIDAIDAQSRTDAARKMKQYVQKWYPAMKGQASFWGKHEQIVPEFSPYSGYWAMCAAAFTYLYNIDDAAYRDELVYPKDLIDYARTLQADASAVQPQLLQLRVVAGNPCTRTGFWMTPARENSRAAFNVGDIMPEVANSDYGFTIWQWVDGQ